LQGDEKRDEEDLSCSPAQVVEQAFEDELSRGDELARS
jgi:hypothetical protein